MPREKKVFSFYGHELRIYAPVDLSKPWFLEYRDHNGDRRRKYDGINQETTYNARWKAAEIEAKKLAATFPTPSSPDKAAVLQYIKENAPSWKKSTTVNVRGIVDKFFTWLGTKRVTRKNVEAFFVELRASAHPSTYNEYLYWLKRILEHTGNRLLFIDVPRNKKVQKTPARYFQPHQVKLLRETIEERDPELWLYIQFVFYCAIRPSRELPWLKAGDIMLDQRQILLHGGAPDDSHTKNSKTQYVAIPDAFVPSLGFVYDMAPNDYIFPGRYDKTKPIGRNTMSARHRKILRELNFGPKYELYSWKHTGAVMAAKSGVGVHQIKIQLRHHSLDETDKYLRQMGVQDLGGLREKFPAI